MAQLVRCRPLAQRTVALEPFRLVVVCCSLVWLPVTPNKPSIAVLPFTNMSGDPEQDYFADGMADGASARHLRSFKELLRQT
jgi:hypothetical protein